MNQASVKVNSKLPLISVITPTFNRAYILDEAITSVIHQSYANWELIVVDDASTDNTEEVVKSFEDKRIKYFNKTNAGAPATRNYGVSKAKGKWITYLDSDDTFYPNCLEVMVIAMEAHKDKVFGLPRGNRYLDLYEDDKLVETVDDSEDMPNAFTLKDIFMRNARFACLGFTHLKCLFDEGLRWDEHVGAMEDWELLMSIGEKYPDGFLYVPESVYSYHQRFGLDGNCSKFTYSDWADVFDYIYNKHKNDKMMKGQTWYPEKAIKWRRRQKLFEQGKLPAYKYHHFSPIN